MVSTVASTRPRLPRKKHLQAVSDGRHAALAVVLLLEQGAQVQAALDGYLRGASLKEQDRALCTELVYGYLRAEIRIEHLLQSLLRNPKKLPREMYLALGLALYALLFLERIPPHATVDWTVGHVRRRFGEPMSRVANGALRSFIRLGDAPKDISFYYPQGQSADSALDAVTLQASALFYSLPLWVVQLWDKAYGPAACTALCQRSLRAPYAGVRVNAQSSHAEELHTALLLCLTKADSATASCDADSANQPTAKSSETSTSECTQTAPGQAVGFCGVAFVAGRSPRSVANAPLSYWQQQGDLSFQSAGSQCVMQALEPRTWPAPVWDMCAGQGGKSAILIEQGLVVALSTDVHVQRLESFTGNMQRLASTFTPSAQPESLRGSQSRTPEQSGLCSDPQSPCSSLPVGAFQTCVLPDTAHCLAAREQAVSLLDAVSTVHGSPAIAVPYPPQQGKKRQSHEAAEDYDEAYAATLDCDDQHADACATEQTSAADSSCTCDDGAAQGSVGLKGGVGQGHVPAYLPLVALMDGCLAPANSWAGTICIDAPCSGLGILHRRPDIRRHRRPDSMEELVAVQADLLDAAWKALKVGGGLVYMTCTLNPAENEDQIQRLLRAYPEARLVRQWQTDHHHPWLEGMFGAYCVKDSPLR